MFSPTSVTSKSRGAPSGVISNGDTANLNYRYQDQSTSGGGSISFFLDDNTDPYDGHLTAPDLGTDSNLSTTGA